MGLVYYSLAIIAVVLLPVKAIECDNFDLKGIFASVLTPLYDNGTIHLDIIPQYAQFLKDNGIDGVAVTATSGEGPNVAASENKPLLEAWMAAAPPLGLYVISDVGAIPLPDAQEMAAYSEELGVDAILAMPESYYRAQNADELVYYFRYIYEAAPNTPLMYDHVPQFSHVDVDMEEFFDLATEQIPTFKGVKSDVFETALLLQNKVRDDQRIFVGDYEAIFAAQVLAGFEGFVMGFPNIFPSLVRDIVTAGQNGDLNQTRALGQELNDLRDAILDDLTQNSFFAALKEAMFLVNNIDVGPPKPANYPLTEEQKGGIEARLEALNITILGSEANNYEAFK